MDLENDYRPSLTSYNNELHHYIANNKQLDHCGTQKHTLLSSLKMSASEVSNSSSKSGYTLFPQAHSALQKCCSTHAHTSTAPVSEGTVVIFLEIKTSGVTVHDSGTV